MNCRNCGGAMDLHSTRGYFFCRYCGSFHFPEAVGAIHQLPAGEGIGAVMTTPPAPGLPISSESSSTFC